MPDKRYKRKESKRCSRCWRNKLKHGNKLKIKNGGRTQDSIRDILRDETTTASEKRRKYIKSDYVVDDQFKVHSMPWKFVLEMENNGAQYKITPQTGRRGGKFLRFKNL